VLFCACPVCPRCSRMGCRVAGSPGRIHVQRAHGIEAGSARWTGLTPKGQGEGCWWSSPRVRRETTY
jgi:hypothetical protein